MSLSILDFAPQVVAYENVYLSYAIAPNILAAVNLSPRPWKVGLLCMIEILQALSTPALYTHCLGGKLIL